MQFAEAYFDAYVLRDSLSVARIPITGTWSRSQREAILANNKIIHDKMPAGLNVAALHASIQQCLIIFLLSSIVWSNVFKPLGHGWIIAIVIQNRRTPIKWL